MFWDKFSSSALQTGRNSEIMGTRYRRKEGGSKALPDTETKPGLSPLSSKALFNKKEGLLTSRVHNIFHYLPNISVKSKSSHWLILYLMGIKIPPTSKRTPVMPNVLGARL